MNPSSAIKIHVHVSIATFSHRRDGSSRNNKYNKRSRGYRDRSCWLRKTIVRDTGLFFLSLPFPPICLVTGAPLGHVKIVQKSSVLQRENWWPATLSTVRSLARLPKANSRPQLGVVVHLDTPDALGHHHQPLPPALDVVPLAATDVISKPKRK